MKKIIILFLFIASAIGSNAQIKKIDSSKLVKPVINAKVKGQIVTPTPQQTNTTPTTNVSIAPPKQTATGMLYTPPSSTTQTPNQPTTTTTTTTTTTNSTPVPTALPDIVITNISFSPNTGNTYAVNYSLKNVGTAAVKKGLLSVQSYINGAPAGGGNSTSLTSETNQLLNPGESMSSRNTFSTNGIIVGNAYTFELCVNGMKSNAGTASEKWVGQQFAESNFTNNVIQSSFTIPPPPPAPADIEVTITKIEKSPADTASFVRIYYTLKNIGETAIPSTASLSLQSRVEDTDNDPSTFLETACCGQATGGNTLGAGEIPLAPGSAKELFYDARVAGGANFSTLPKNVLYKFNIQITGNGFTDGNNSNNKSGFNYLLH
ncbi:hypothetical protein VRU48_06655 [Pedobacter sp. KR3-3]|uniref:CARDB domain-containing protein n=1 Tax=Pedobacter albus TaxID=3113905 RepID=A0ABU7I5Y3_9SPHI|nr:hypothetical protein [Pedobacter sp. KR3-3]MEE1944779.1 hypothetical protein [Pedobacter sp. KR3-3]